MYSWLRQIAQPQAGMLLFWSSVWMCSRITETPTKNMPAQYAGFQTASKEWDASLENTHLWRCRAGICAGAAALAGWAWVGDSDSAQAWKVPQTQACCFLALHHHRPQFDVCGLMGLELLMVM